MEARQLHQFHNLIRREKPEPARPMTQWVEAALESDIFYETVPLIDVARLGFSVQTMVAYPQGSRLVLHIKGHPPMHARAVWHANNRLGAWFDEPLDDAMLASLTEAG
jgi:hypothetical protein